MPPKEGRIEVFIDTDFIARLDLSPFHTGITSPLSADPNELLELTVGFTINYRREDENDVRELSEFPDVIKVVVCEIVRCVSMAADGVGLESTGACTLCSNACTSPDHISITIIINFSISVRSQPLPPAYL